MFKTHQVFDTTPVDAVDLRLDISSCRVETEAFYHRGHRKMPLEMEFQHQGPPE